MRNFEEISYVNFSNRPPPSQYLLHLQAFGETIAHKRWVRKRSEGFNRSFSLEYILDGECVFTDGSVKQVLRRGEFFLFRESMTNSLASNPATGVRKYYITLAYNLLLGRLYALPQEQFLATRPRDPELILRLYEEIRSLANEGGKYQESELLGKVYQLFSELVYSGSINEFTDEYSRMLSAINYSPEQYLNLKTLSAEFKLSRYALSRFFREKLNTTPMEYVITQRYNKACWYLENQVTPVNVIACSCGFNSVPFFTNEFKIRFGVSPLEFRRRRQKTQELGKPEENGCGYNKM